MEGGGGRAGKVGRRREGGGGRRRESGAHIKIVGREGRSEWAERRELRGGATYAELESCTA